MTNRYENFVRPSAKKSVSNTEKTSFFDDIFLPLPPINGAESIELETYARFMRHIRLVPNSRPDIKVLSAIQFTSDYLDLGGAFVSRVLADMGLRAPRRAFPEDYLDYVDRSCLRLGSDFGAPCASTVDMMRYWNDIGEGMNTMPVSASSADGPMA